jgi:hypothetical protein
VDDLSAFGDGDLLDGYLAEAAWFWFNASTAEKRLETKLHRLVAHCLAEEVRRRGLPEPGPDAIYAHARRTFPPDDLHARYQSDHPSSLDIFPNHNG